MASNLVFEYVQKLNRVATRIGLTLVWVRGHIWESMERKRRIFSQKDGLSLISEVQHHMRHCYGYGNGPNREMRFYGQYSSCLN